MSPAPRSGPRWNEVTALFGGSFDPPHLGHREAVAGLFQNPGVREVRVIPCPLSPLKSASFATLEQRLEMVRLGFEPGSGPASVALPPEVRLDLRELRRPGPAYSFDTIQEIRGRETPEVAFVIGTDQLENLHRWHRFPELLRACHWIVLARRPDGQPQAERTLNEWATSGLVKPAGGLGGSGGQLGPLWQIRGGTTFLALYATQARPLSSTFIRETISRTGAPPSDSLTPEVIGYLKTHRVYGMSGPNG